jgi:hypothetical protein
MYKLAQPFSLPMICGRLYKGTWVLSGHRNVYRNLKVNLNLRRSFAFRSNILHEVVA